MAILSWRKSTWTQNCEKLWSNTCERTQSKEKEQAVDSSYPKGIEVLLRETARKGYANTENVDNPMMMAPHDYIVRPSRRVVELQNRSLDTTNRSVLALFHSYDHS